ncbi:hypothetical protein [Paenibacillus arenosi]|uniref:Uncharacterized protein n=1 Tax=Paenibacillus arenosi TaxID=2774142 RepID=A0ABR9AZ69_9BACL|nr:hypothetical protein [Paenibacillus arenosi]MBD8499379.1 hypothetical protein [Paenibacillus arenosi]
MDQPMIVGELAPFFYRRTTYFEAIRLWNSSKVAAAIITCYPLGGSLPRLKSV